MKKVVLNFLVIAAFAISAFTSCKNSDDGDNNGIMGPLLETMTFADDDFAQLEYDDKNRITRISEYSEDTVDETTFIYSGDDLVKVISVNFTIEFAKSKNKVTFTGTWKNTTIEGTIDLNKDGLPTKKEWKSVEDDNYHGMGLSLLRHSSQTYQYSGGNLSESILFSVAHVVGIEQPTMFPSDERLLSRHIIINYNEYDNNISPLYYCKTPIWYWICFDSEFVFGYKNNATDFSTDGTRSELRYEYNSDRLPIKCSKVGEDEGIIEYKYK